MTQNIFGGLVLLIADVAFLAFLFWMRKKMKGNRAKERESDLGVFYSACVVASGMAIFGLLGIFSWWEPVRNIAGIFGVIGFLAVMLGGSGMAALGTIWNPGD